MLCSTNLPVRAGAPGTPLRPVIAGEWRRICEMPDRGELAGANPRQQHIVDHGFVRAAHGQWQLWACLRGTGVGRLLYGWQGESLQQGPWKPIGVVARADQSYGGQATAKNGQRIESIQAPFFTQEGGWFYLFRASSTTFRTYVYRSPDPASFGLDDDQYLIAEFKIKAPVTIRDGDREYISDLADFRGIKIAPLRWEMDNRASEHKDLPPMKTETVSEGIDSNSRSANRASGHPGVWRRAAIAGLVLRFVATVGFAAAPAPLPKLNVVLILADDLGWTDLRCYGSDLYQTPHLDQLARDGMRFTQNYSACTVCSPTRAALLTGKYPARLRLTDWIPGLPPENPKLLVPDWTQYLPREEPTLADAFKAAGYATASIGKWHLGGEPYYPEHHGFDRNVAGTDAPAPKSYFAPWTIATLPEGAAGDYLTDRLGDEALRFLGQRQAAPFFLYLPHFAVHTPIQGRPDRVAKYRALPRAGLTHSNAVYAAMVEGVDLTVGRIRQKLVELGLAERTVIVFTSDNGGRVPTTSNHPLRVGKGSCYEGGTRVPLILHWPGVTQAGSVSDVPVISMDLYPTLLEIAGVRDVAGHQPDGLSLVPVLRGQGTLARDALYWHYPHYQHYQLGGTTPYGAIRHGDFKLIEFFDDARVELYNLARDIGERTDLAANMPERVNPLRDRLHAWRNTVHAQLPTRNPQYDPARPEHTPRPSRK